MTFAPALKKAVPTTETAVPALKSTKIQTVFLIVFFQTTTGTKALKTFI